MARVRFEPTISVGTILSVITLLMALWGMTVRLEGRLSTMETKLEPMWLDYTGRLRAVKVEK